MAARAVLARVRPNAWPISNAQEVPFWEMRGITRP
jgi:hypothetical protein